MQKTNFQTKPKKPDLEINKPSNQQLKKGPWNFFIWYFLISIFLFYIWQSSLENRREEIPYSQFQGYLAKGQIDTATVSDRKISGLLKLKDAKSGKPRRFVTVPLLNTDLAKELDAHGVKYSVKIGQDWMTGFLMNWILPFGFLAVIWIFIFKRMGKASTNFLNLGQNKVHIHANNLEKITFKDVAGVNEAKQELNESIEFLRNPEHFQRLGGRMPKGVLLVGPPGTGKTLLARAVAGEAEVPFFNISGSEFIEMFVGVGAARVRDLFEQARKKAPCIIFIDELDAIGRARGGPMVMGGHDEREQTLNQILVEMDGFDSTAGVVVMAATNRPEILDKALLRAGRFDRHIVVDKPDLKDRVEILQIHTEKLMLAKDVDLKVVAQRTPGFVGADLANIANEAALMAARFDHNAVMMNDFEAAIDRVIAGPEKKNRTLGPKEKHRVAYHESGHTLVAVIVPTGEPVHKVSIIPRGIGALGYTLQLPVDEKFLSTKNELTDQIAILLGGRVSEEIVLGDVSSGAQNDLERASEIARSMVCQLGMSEKLGPLTWGKRQRSQFLDVDYGEEKNYSEETARLIDEEVKNLIEENHRRVREILTENRQKLDDLAMLLEEKEVISGEEVMEMVAPEKIEQNDPS
ncbi:MAG TPA: ATP-dependent metallopeptidase FtsH/Yme1/Tma family protein [Bacteroidetes bacterium]|nr:ATP-dependent metallopeptidase FtsH/Yme1/Tma family protein [Bacteroidota bacterium]